MEKRFSDRDECYKDNAMWARARQGMGEASLEQSESCCEEGIFEVRCERAEGRAF